MLHVEKMTEFTGYDQIVLDGKPICYACLRPISASFNWVDRQRDHSHDPDDDWCACWCKMRIHTTCRCRVCKHGNSFVSDEVTPYD